MADLHVWHDGEADWFVAESAEEAAELQWALTGIEPEDQEWEFTQVPDAVPITIQVDEKGKPTDYGEGLRLPCSEWIKRNGKGFLCSTEF